MRIRGSLLLALRFLGFGSGKSVSNARKSLYGAIAGIGISLVPLVIVLVVSDGMIEGISSRLIELSSSHIRVVDYSGSSELSGDPEGMKRLAAKLSAVGLKGTVTGAVAERQGIGIVVGPKGRSGGTIRAVEPSFFSGDSAVRSLVSVSSGSLDFGSDNEAFVGKKLADDIGVAVGDTFRVITMRSGPGGQAFPRFTSFRVKAIISSGYQELDALWVFIPYDTGCKILSGESSYSFINVRVVDPFGKIEGARRLITREVPDGFSVYTWKEMNRSQFQSFNTTRTLLLFIMLLIVFVASVNVSSALVMLVMERRREIAILKSTGTTTESLSFAFILAGFLTGLGGLVAGMPIGIFCAIHVNGLFSWMERGVNAVNRFVYALLSPNVGAGPEAIHLLDPAYYLEKIPVHLRMDELFLVAAGTLVLSVLVSLLPAIRAGREKPVDTLRKV